MGRQLAVIAHDIVVRRRGWMLAQQACLNCGRRGLVRLHVGQHVSDVRCPRCANRNTCPPTAPAVTGQCRTDLWIPFR